MGNEKNNDVEILLICPCCGKISKMGDVGENKCNCSKLDKFYAMFSDNSYRFKTYYDGNPFI